VPTRESSHPLWDQSNSEKAIERQDIPAARLSSVEAESNFSVEDILMFVVMLISEERIFVIYELGYPDRMRKPLQP